MYQTALLLLSGPLRLLIESIGPYLSWTNKKIAKCLYVKLEPELYNPISKSDSINLKRLSTVVPVVYHKASSLCKNVDVRVLLGNIEQSKLTQSKQLNFDAIVTNCDPTDIRNYLKQNYGKSCDNIIKLNDIDTPVSQVELESDDTEFQTFDTVCLGGTFDRLHNGHKVFLSEAALKATKKIIVGVSDGVTLKKKILWELIEPVEKRIKDVTDFLEDIDSSLKYEVVPIYDVYGPTITLPDIDCLVVTTETRIGGEKVNNERKNRGMSEVKLHIIDVVENTDRSKDEDEKLSSSTKRMHLLGKPLKISKPSLISKPYCVLLRGHPLSGKSFVANKLQLSGIPVLCCDEMLSAIFHKDSELKKFIIKEFGEEICNDEDSFVFEKLVIACLKNKEKKDCLAQLVLTKLTSALQQVFQVYSEQGSHTILVKDSSIFEGCELGIKVNEIWATILPASESIKLFKEHYLVTEEEAGKLIDSLPSNEQYVATANVLFCNKWSPDTTQQQVNRAFSYLKSIQKST
ncbi:bifunctional coenzyme A synthase-like [Argiope bruennichi]|uniref:bifunctional coenzyme A synthase-like n=1 Tax=Argiope bruennichi TaxID=94029 RepID=UPI00249492B6|nr:bifunctional coenzyme A synthase-like [Argiope bruennichi]